MDQVLYQKALDFATLAHDGQKRKSGEAFINHPKTVSETLLFGDWMTRQLWRVYCMIRLRTEEQREMI